MADAESDPTAEPAPYTTPVTRALHRPAALVVALTVVGALLVAVWRAGALGAAYRPWNAAVARRVDAAMVAVQGPDRNAMFDAQMELAHAGPDTVRPLLGYLNAASPRARHLATSVLGHTGDWTVIEPLTERLDDSSPIVRQSAVLALHRLGARRSASVIRAHSADTNPGMRATVAMALGDLKDGENVDTLIVLMGDEDGAVRWMAAVSLGRLGNTRAVPILVAHLGDAKKMVRMASAGSLSRLTGLPPHFDQQLWRAWWFAQSRG